MWTQDLVKANNRKGFTLVEILIVLGIMGAIIALGLGRIRKKDNDIKKVAREFYILGKEVRNKARLKNSTFRLVLQLGDGDKKYWLESAQGFQGRVDEEEVSKLREEDRPPELFQKDDSLFKTEKKLPDGLWFKSLESVDQEPLTTGTGYIYFYANGFVEASALQITDKKRINWTIIYHPLTGQADIIPEEKNLKDAQQKQ